MSTRLTVATICMAAALAACSDEYDADTEPGWNGKPGSALQQVYSQEFRVAKGDYFAALNEFYSFAVREGFERIDFGMCFADVPDFRSNESLAPCIGMFAAKGAPTKAHMTFTIAARSFYRLDHKDYLTCRIDIYINGSYAPARTIAPDFRETVDSRLQELDRKSRS